MNIQPNPQLCQSLFYALAMSGRREVKPATLPLVERMMRFSPYGPLATPFGSLSPMTVNALALKRNGGISLEKKPAI